MSPEELELYRNLKTDVDEVKADVKKLLAFKWQIFGGFAVLSVVVTAIIQLMAKGGT